jgi:flagellar biosynthesis protein FlhG
MAHLIGIASGKGGVGKTTMTINLAIALQKSGLSTLVLDADLGLANAQLMMGVKPTYTRSDLISGNLTLDEIEHNCYGGVGLIPGASGKEGLTNLSTTTLTDLINLLKASPKQIVLLDTAAGISEQNMQLLSNCDSKLIIFLDEPSSIADAYGVLKIQQSKTGLGSTFLVPNKVDDQSEGKQLFSKMNGLCMSFLSEPTQYVGSIRRDPKVLTSVRSRSPLAKQYPESLAWHDIRLIAGQLAQSLTLN